MIAIKIEAKVGDIVRYRRFAPNGIADVDITGYVTNVGEYEVDPMTYYDIEWLTSTSAGSRFGRYTMEAEANAVINELWEVVG